MNHRGRFNLITACVVLGFMSNALAQELHVHPGIGDCSIELDPALTQAQFHKFSREVTQFFAFKLMSAAEPLGARRVQFGLDYAITRIDDADPAWNNTFSHPHAEHYLGDQIPIPKLFVKYGVTDRLDAGLYFTKNWNANYGFMGGELKYALFAHTERSFALAARASYATLLGVEDLNFHVASLDLSASKKLGRFAPYVGLGFNWSRALETTAKVRLANETLITPRGVVGTELSLGLVSFTTELEIAAVPTFSLRTGFTL